MRIVGLSGGYRRAHEPSGPALGLYTHDGASVLVEDGHIVAACEQERLDRIKHSDKAPVDALERVLSLARLTRNDVDVFAFYSSEANLDRALQRAALQRGERAVPARALLASTLSVPADKLVFVKHHLAHAASAYGPSGWNEALIATFDGLGEDESGVLAVGRGPAIDVFRSVPPHASLGQLYCDVIAFLGYGLFDEYKVMGLAPYGDPTRYRALFESLYTLEPGGHYRLHHERIGELYALGTRRRGEPFTAVHHDIAAALQATLLTLVMHVLSHARRETGLTRLCLAGGVAHNCTVNGEILRSGLFDDVFVQPAAHDAGCALGAALAVHLSRGGAPAPRMTHVFFGTEAGDPAPALERWSAFVSFEKKDDIVAHTADRLALGEVVGWVQGRAEFGPRALGHRSILADPRPPANKTRINAMVKKREGYRPFAPSVTAEDASRYFEVDREHPFMTYVVPVRPEHRETLGAVTHVDGSARIQTVSPANDERYAALLRAFGARTGIAVLLNTSFNNHAEPIVDSVEDAIVCFLTTGLDALAVGDFWVVKKTEPPWERLSVALAPHVRMEKVVSRHRSGSHTTFRIVPSHDPEGEVAITETAYEALEAGRVTDEVVELWSRRVVVLWP